MVTQTLINKLKSPFWSTKSHLKRSYNAIKYDCGYEVVIGLLGTKVKYDAAKHAYYIEEETNCLDLGTDVDDNCRFVVTTDIRSKRAAVSVALKVARIYSYGFPFRILSVTEVHGFRMTRSLDCHVHLDVHVRGKYSKSWLPVYSAGVSEKSLNSYRGHAVLALWPVR